MEAMNQLQAKLHRAQAEIEESIGHLTKQRAFIANRLADGADVTQSCDLLVTLEDTHFIHVQAPRPTEKKTGRGSRGETAA